MRRHLSWLPLIGIMVLTLTGFTCTLGIPPRHTEPGPVLVEVGWVEITPRPDGARCWMVGGNNFMNGTSCETTNYHNARIP